MTLRWYAEGNATEGGPAAARNFRCLPRMLSWQFAIQQGVSHV